MKTNAHNAHNLSHKQLEALKSAFVWHGMYKEKLDDDYANPSNWEMYKSIRDEKLAEAGFKGLIS